MNTPKFNIMSYKISSDLSSNCHEPSVFLLQSVCTDVTHNISIIPPARTKTQGHGNTIIARF